MRQAAIFRKQMWVFRKGKFFTCNPCTPEIFFRMYHRLVLSTQSVGAMLWSKAQLRRGQLRMVVDVVGSC